MRIGIVCPYTWNVPGGVQQHIGDLAEALIGLGHDVSVITPTDDDAELPHYVVSAGRAVPVPYNGSAARLAFGFLSAGRVRRWIHEGGFDVLHVHEPAAPPRAAGLLGGGRAHRRHLPRVLREVAGGVGDRADPAERPGEDHRPDRGVGGRPHHARRAPRRRRRAHPERRRDRAVRDGRAAARLARPRRAPRGDGERSGSSAGWTSRARACRCCCAPSRSSAAAVPGCGCCSPGPATPTT